MASVYGVDGGAAVACYS